MLIWTFQLPTLKLFLWLHMRKHLKMTYKNDIFKHCFCLTLSFSPNSIEIPSLHHPILSLHPWPAELPAVWTYFRLHCIISCFNFFKILFVCLENSSSLFVYFLLLPEILLWPFRLYQTPLLCLLSGMNSQIYMHKREFCTKNIRQSWRIKTKL